MRPKMDRSSRQQAKYGYQPIGRKLPVSEHDYGIRLPLCGYGNTLPEQTERPHPAQSDESPSGEILVLQNSDMRLTRVASGETKARLI